MWIKNLIVYRLPAHWAVEAEDLERKLAKTPLQRCGGFQMESRGWTCPFEEEQYLYNQNRHWLLALGMEEKLLPASIIRQEALDRAEKLAKKQAHPVGRKQMRDIREEVTNEFMPRALACRRLTHCWIDGINRWLVVDAAGDPRAEEFMENLRRADESCQALRLETERSPASAMAEWLIKGEAPLGFTIDQDLELRAADASKATVRYSHHNLGGKEIRDHLSTGKTVVRLGLTWNDRISFVLTEQYHIKRVTFLDILRRESDAAVQDEKEQFEIDFALMTGELSQMLADLVKALGGENEKA